MKKITIFLVVIALTYGNEKSQRGSPSVFKSHEGGAGGIVSITVDFDIYRVKAGSREAPSYYYIIMPAPDVGIGGRYLTYLGRMPAGTQLEIISLKRGKWFQRMSYWVKPISSINGRLKGHPSREPHIPQENLDEQIYRLSSIASNVGLYQKGHYSNGAPKLNETWFTLIKLNE